jgi:hypothetical protein
LLDNLLRPNLADEFLFADLADDFRQTHRGKEPERDREAYPWFWKESGFAGERINDVHLTNAQKQAARHKKR